MTPMTATRPQYDRQYTAAPSATDIMVPLDGSAFAEQALGVAEALARRTGASVHLVRVNEPLLPGGLPASQLWREEVFRIHEEYLIETAADARASGVPVWTTLVDGSPIPVLAEEAERSGASLVVMATHGRTGVQRAWLGSVADGVARHCRVPLLLHRPRGGFASGIPFTGFSNILIALDGSRNAEAVLAPAAGIAKAFDADVLLLRVVAPVQLAILPVPMAPPVTAPDAALTELHVREAGVYLENVALRLRAMGVRRVDQRVTVAPGIGETVVDTAEEVKADLVALTSRRHGAARLVFGSVPDRVLRKLRESVLLAPETT